MSLEARQVSYCYQQQSALRQVSITVTPGEKVVIGGVNGSGKSTLLKVMAGLYLPDEGRVTVDDCHSRTGGHLLPGVGLVVANPERYFFAATVEEEIAYSLQQKGIKARAGRDKLTEALTAVGLDSNYLNRNPFYLSLGEQRKVGIAAILVQKPRYLLLDEPFSSLDFPGIGNLISFLSDYAASGSAVVVSSHRATQVAQWGERLLVMEAGGLLYDGSMAAWQLNPQRPLMLGEAAYLGYCLRQQDIMVKYTGEPEKMAEQIISAVGKGGG